MRVEDLTPTHWMLLGLCRVRPSVKDLAAVGALAKRAEIDWTELTALACRAGLAGLVERNLGILEGAKSLLAVRQSLAHHALRAQAQNQLLLDEGHRLCVAATAEGLTLVPLKGTALHFLGVYDDPGLRDQCDLDLLARRDELERVDRLLRRLGLEEDRTHREYSLRHLHHLTYFRTGALMRVTLELHWTGLLSFYGNRRVEQDMLQRCYTTEVRGHPMKMLSVEDLAFLVLLHLCIHRYRGQLKWLVDVAEVARAYDGLSWDRVFQLAHGTGSLRAVVFAVALARQLLDAPIPDQRPPWLSGVLQRLNPISDLVTSQPQPSWCRRALVNLFAFDSPFQGGRFLVAKGVELLERYQGLRLPSPSRGR